MFTRVCWCAYYACVPVRARVFGYTLECSQSRLFSVHTHTLESKTEKPLIFFFSLSPYPEENPILSLPLSPSLRLSFSLSQLGWRHTWKCWPDSTLGPNLVIQRRGSAEGKGVGVWGMGGVGRGWKSLPLQDQRQPRLRPPNPTSALYKDLPPHPNFDSHAISQWSDARRKHFHFFSL